jgi:hypothetical protein
MGVKETEVSLMPFGNYRGKGRGKSEDRNPVFLRVIPKNNFQKQASIFFAIRYIPVVG